MKYGLAEGISSLCGWFYFVAWSFSFYPQAILNFRRRTTQGVEPDFWLLNIVGFTCYTISAATFIYSKEIRREYADRHPLSPEPTVRFNDLVFGVHALIFSLLTYSQFFPRLWGWKPVPGVKRHANIVTLGLISGGALAVAVVVFLVIHSQAHSPPQSRGQWQWIDVIYTTSYIKLLLTIFKYVPQAIANYRRRSTLGWSISQQLLDFTGGILSLLQLVIDSSLQGDWSGLTGNPMKLGLSNISLLFDILFIAQHFVLYGPVAESDGATFIASDSEQRPQNEREPLLGNPSK